MTNLNDEGDGYMKKAIFYGKNDIRIEDSEIPTISSDEVLIKIMACGVCGTDVHIFEGAKGAAECEPPKVLGHEFSGIIEAVGANSTVFKKGDRVCVDPNTLCGTCYYCHSGIGHFCENMIGIGTTIDGGFAQYCAINRKQVHRIADSTTFEQGAMAEPLACCLHGIDLCNIKPGSIVVVIGGGMIGLITLQLAMLAGASRVALIEPVAEKRSMALKLGATLCIDPNNEDVLTVLRNNNMSRVEVAIECVGLPQTMKLAIDIAGKKSTVMMFGLTKPDEEIAIKPFDIFRKEIELKASFINPYTMERAVELINSNRIDVVSMQCEPIPLEKLLDVLKDADMRKKGKYLVKPN